MENKDIILFILIICVIYLLYCNSYKEPFTEFFTGSSTSVSTTGSSTESDEKRIATLVEKKFTQLSNETITDSIKNLGLLAKEIQKGGDLTLPANLNVTADLNVTGKLNLLPEGTVVMWTKSEIPDGWVKCNGENKTPDLRGRFVLGGGNGNELTNRTLSATGGAETHTLTVAQMPYHRHQLTDDAGNQHLALSDLNLGANHAAGRYLSDGPNETGSDTGIKQTSSSGSNGSHNNMPPYFVLIYIMKVY